MKIDVRSLTNDFVFAQVPPALEYDPAAMAYRLKFIRNGRVVFVDVDARSGQVLSER